MSKPLLKKQLKLLIGEYVFVIPTYNSIMRGTPVEDQILKFKVVSCGTSLAHYDKGKYPIDGGCDSGNCGYLPFESLKSIENYFKVLEFAQEARESNFFKGLSIKQVNAIKQIMKQKD